MTANPKKDEPEDTSPLLGGWRNVYLLLVAELALTVAVLYGLTRWAS